MKKYHRIVILSKHYWAIELESKGMLKMLNHMAEQAISYDRTLPLTNGLVPLTSFHISLPSPEQPFHEMGVIDIPRDKQSQRLFKELALTCMYNRCQFSQQMDTRVSCSKKRSAWVKANKPIVHDILNSILRVKDHEGEKYAANRTLLERAGWSYGGFESRFKPHISLANLTGESRDSIKHPEQFRLKEPWFDNDCTDEEKAMLVEDAELMAKEENSIEEFHRQADEGDHKRSSIRDWEDEQ
jgi:hypothetical protein